MIFYGYEKCGSCKKALKWLAEREIEVEEKPIRENPPTMEELKYVLEKYDGEVKRLFNTAGQTYRQLGLKDLLGNLTVDEQLEMLTAEGNLVKRPFLIDQKRGVGLVGFKEAEWEAGL